MSAYIHTHVHTYIHTIMAPDSGADRASTYMHTHVHTYNQVPAGGPAWLKIQEQIEYLKYRLAIVQMEKRMFVPFYTTTPGEAAFEHSEKTNIPNKAFQLAQIPQPMEYTWVAQKQEAGKITLGTGCVFL